MTRFRDDPWFAGFTDGEGCFYFMRSRKMGTVVPTFRIALRGDDYAVLAALHGEFGGGLSMSYPTGREHPEAGWTVAHKEDLTRLVTYFDHFPLQSKKARDYAIWRLAVQIYVQQGRRAPELADLHSALVEGRKL